MQHGVEAALARAASLRIIDLQSAVADHALTVQAAELEIMRMGANRLPADLAAGAEAADVALELKFLARRQLLPDAQADERVDPAEVARLRERPLAGLAQPEQRDACKIKASGLLSC